MRIWNHRFGRRGALSLVAMGAAVSVACEVDVSGPRSPESTAPQSQSLLSDTTYGGGPVTDGDLPPRTVILTFDDGPDGPPGSSTPDMTLAIARYLSTQGIHATFFINGRRFLGQQPSSGCPLFDSGGVPGVGHASGPFKQYPEGVLDTLVSLGHRIANHTQDHCNLVTGNASYADQEILPTQTILDRHALNGPYLFRPPYGSWAVPDAQSYAQSDACLDKLEGPINWDVDGGDWQCWIPEYNTGDPNPWPAAGGVSGCLQGYVNSLASRTNMNGVFLHHDRPEPAVATADMYGTNLQGANHYTAQTVSITNPDGTTTTLPGTYPSNQLGMITAEVTYLKSQGFSFARIEDLYSGRRVRSWSTAPSCAANQPAAVLGYSDADTGGAAGSFSASPGYYRSLHLADVTGDGFADACARVGAGIECAVNRGNGQFGATSLWFNSNFLDSQGWNPSPYGTTVQFADVNRDGRADVCGRGGAGVYCASSTGGAFTGLALTTAGADFSDAAGWANAESYYGSLHFADVNGDGWVDLCGRGAAGVYCALNAATGALQFGAATLWTGADFKDSTGWQPAQYGATMQLGDINGDGRADVCARGGSGMRCALSTGIKFGAPRWWASGQDFSDSDPNAGGWQQPYYYKSIRLVDVNRDGKADVCGRTANGVVCGLSAGGTFQAAQAMSTPRETTSGTSVTTTGNDYTDALGWAADQYGSTIMFGNLDGDGLVDVCGRGGDGMLCSLSRSPCAGSDAIGDVFAAGMYGCPGHVTWEKRASLCGRAYHVCSAAEWTAKRDGAAPRHDYWTNNNLGYAGQPGACYGAVGASSCSNGTTAEPMHVCTSSGTDAEGNSCNWTHCGVGSTQDQYIGGCVNDEYAGSLCCGGE